MSQDEKRFRGALARLLVVVSVGATMIGVPVAQAGAAALGAAAPGAQPAAAGDGETAAPVPAEGAALAAAPAQAATQTTPRGSIGYWTVAADGGLYNFGVANLGGLRGHPLNQPVVAMAANANGTGYWLVASDGGIFTFGDAGFYGSKGGEHLNEPIVGMAATPDGKGYWLVASDGGIFTFGDAGFYGSKGGEHLNEPIVGMAATPDGKGYWLVASDGGIFTFGDAGFYGSKGGEPLNQPVVGMAATNDGSGYWLVASDGGIFTFGTANFEGSEGGHPLNRPITTMAATPDGDGYWMIATDGGVFSFGDAPFLGSTGADPGPAPIVDMAAVVSLGATGYDISWPQCRTGGKGPSLPPSGSAVAIVGVTNGYIGVSGPPGSPYGPNPCLSSEAAWAGPEMQAYQVATPIDAGSGDLSNATAGPRACPTVADTVACGYNWGWNNALQAVALVHRSGLFPHMWWLDVELDEHWNPNDTAVSAQIIQGMVDAYRSQGLTAGIYCTSYQWGYITGDYPIPGVPTWIAGAGNIATGTYSAVAFCTNAGFDFADGVPTLVQFGYVGSGYDGPSSKWDQDFVCPS